MTRKIILVLSSRVYAKETKCWREKSTKRRLCTSSDKTSAFSTTNWWEWRMRLIIGQTRDELKDRALLLSLRQEGSKRFFSFPRFFFSRKTVTRTLVMLALFSILWLLKASAHLKKLIFKRSNFFYILIRNNNFLLISCKFSRFFIKSELEHIISVTSIHTFNKFNKIINFKYTCVKILILNTD